MKHLLLLLLLLFVNNTYADEFDEFAGEEEGGGQTQLVDFAGFVEIEHGSNDSDTVLASRKFRLDAAKTFDGGGVFSKIDFINDDVTGNTFVATRELRLQYKLSDNFDLSLGRQVATWGVADMLFINDLFPKNWVANFTGRDFEMLKEAADSARITSYFGGYTIDTVYMPKFTPDTTPTGCRFEIYNPNTQGLILNTNSCSDSLDNTDSNKSETAVSIRKSFGGFEFALYGYAGHYKAPKGIELDGGAYVGFYPKLSVYGVSVEGQAGPGIFTFESGYYESKDDLAGDDSLIENSKLKYLLGYRMDLTSQFSFGVQIYQEKMSNYSEYEGALFASNPNAYKYRENEISSTYTLRLTYKAMQDTLVYSLFTYVRPDDHDSFTKLEASKQLYNDYKVTVGASVFTGDDNYLDREFGMLKDSDNIYLRGRYSF